MPCLSIPARSVVAALCLTAGAAQADLTKNDVWSDWKSYMESAGYAVTGEPSSRGDTLIVTGVGMALNDVASGATARVDMGTVRFIEEGDGTVRIELPARYDMDVTMAPESGEAIDLSIDFSHGDPVMRASGVPQNVTYEYTASTASIALSGLTVNGLPVGDNVAKFAVTAQDMSLVAQSALGTLRSVNQTVGLAGLTYEIAFRDPEGEASFNLTGLMRDIGWTGRGALPLDGDTQDLNAMLDAGFNVDGAVTTAGGNYDLAFQGPDGSGTASSSSEGVEINLAISTAGLVYDVLQRNVNFSMLMTEFPLPLSFSAGEMGTNVQLPVKKAAEDQGFGLGVTLSDVTVSDVIWGLFDPSGALPRDPAKLVVDLSGQAKVLFDFLDPGQAAILERTGATPGELTALNLNTLELDIAGAKLTGAGDFTFDNTDKVTFDGMPRPLGAVDLTLQGGNGLIDKLVGIGLIPEQQAMGARLVMGLFAVPGDAPDTLNSRIEVNPEGHVMANGQRIR